MEREKPRKKKGRNVQSLFHLLRAFLNSLNNYFQLGQVNAWTALPSSYAVEVKDEHDIANAVNFAKNHNLRLVVKGTGNSIDIF